MQQQRPILPPTIDRAGYEALRPHATLWLSAMRAICRRHGLPRDQLARFGDGSDTSFGTNVVFALGEGYVIKLYPPYWDHFYQAERTVAEHAYRKIGITTPEIYAHGTLDGWPYLVMSRVAGTYLAAIWKTMKQENQLQIVIKLAKVLVRLHSLPAAGLPHLNTGWPAFVQTRISNGVQRHREQGLAEDWLRQMPDYLARAEPLYPVAYTPAIVSGDIHDYHLLARKDEHGQWRLCGLFDFDDARIGFYEYDIASVGLFMMAGRPALLRAFLLAYGYDETDLGEPLRRRLMAYTLLHPYRPLNWLREEFARRPCSTLEELAEEFYAIGTLPAATGDR